MFINKKISAFSILAIALNTVSVQAAEDKKTFKDFLSDSEFSLQREITQPTAIGQKGLVADNVHKTDITDVLTVDLIDPFINEAVAGTKMKIEELDDGIEYSVDDEVAESISSFRGKIEEYFESIEKQEDINVLDLLNNLNINRIVSSPVEYVYIRNKQYNENDIFKVKVNRFVNSDGFNEMLDSVKVETENSEEAELLSQMKEDALNRYNALVNNPETALNIIDIEVFEIKKHLVVFLVDGKKYTLKMQG